MAAERDLERRVAGALHDWLDAEPAPHPRWDDAPARMRRPKAAGIPVPVRVLAVAALVAGVAGGALWVGGMLRVDEVPVTARVLCADIEDYPDAGYGCPATGRHPVARGRTGQRAVDRRPAARRGGGHRPGRCPERADPGRRSSDL